MFETIATLHWFYRYLVFLGIGTVLSLSMLLIPRKHHLRSLGLFSLGSPNWISLWRIPVIAAGTMLYLSVSNNASGYSPAEYHQQLFIGFMLIVFGLTLDRIDGRVAKVLVESLHPYQDEWPPRGNSGTYWVWDGTSPEVRPPDTSSRRIVMEPWLGKLMKPQTRMPMFRLDPKSRTLYLTGIGEWLDPLIDKVNLIPLFLYLSYQGYLSLVVTTIRVISELASTLLRPPLIDLSWFSGLRKYVRETKAGPFGKTKVICQFVSLLLVIPASSGWLSQRELAWSYVITSSTLGVGLFAGLLSSLFRLKPMQDYLKNHGWSQYYRRFRQGFEHQVDE